MVNFHYPDLNKLAWLLLIPLSSPVWAEGGIKCWTNDDGVKECGNVVPPQYSQKGHVELSGEGTVVKEVAAAKSKEEIAEEQRKEEEKRKCQEQANKDQALLNLFSKAEDIEIARQAIVSTIDGQINSIQTIVDSLEKNLQELERNFEESKDNKDVPDSQRETMKRNIESAKQRINNNQDTLNTRIKEREDANKEYDLYAQRFKEIKARRATQLPCAVDEKKGDNKAGAAPKEGKKPPVDPKAATNVIPPPAAPAAPPAAPKE